MQKIKRTSFAILLLFVLAACTSAAPGTSAPAETAGLPVSTLAPLLALPSATPEAAPSVEVSLRFAVIGDFGQAENSNTFAVAEMIDTWDVDFIVTTGDNNYPEGQAETIDDNIGQFYHRYIGNYQGDYNRGSEENRFWPSLGNHDWVATDAQPYLDYFTLPGNERYYDVDFSSVHLFILDSDPKEPDGVGRSSDQAAWLEEAMAASSAEWNLVVMHHPPYSSGYHGSSDWMQWPFADWGADIVLSGHDHLYERLDVGGLAYITNGLGGHGAVYDFENILPQSLVRYNTMHGAMLVEATPDWIRFDFINIAGEVVDSLTLYAE